MKVIVLKSCLALLPSFEGSGQLDLSDESRGRTIAAITSASRADMVLGGSDMDAGDALIASHSLMVDEYTIRDIFGRDWPINGDFLTAVELRKSSNYQVVESTTVPEQLELDSVRQAVLRIRLMTVCALLAGDDFHTALLNGVHCWARRMLYLGKALQTAAYTASTDIVWGLEALLPENAPLFAAQAARRIDEATVVGLDCYVSGKIVEVSDKRRIDVTGTQQVEDVCTAGVMAGMLGDENWVDINIAAASVMLMYRRGLGTAEISRSRSADVLDCLDEEGEGELGAALTKLWAFDSGVPAERVIREPHWAGSYAELKRTVRRNGVRMGAGAGIEMVLGAPDEIRVPGGGRERLFIEDGELRKKRGNGIVQGTVAGINHAAKISVLGSGVELRRVRATDRASSTTLLSLALSARFGAEVGIWALGKVLTGGIRIGDSTGALRNASYGVGVEAGGGTLALAYVDQDIMSNIAVYDDGEDALLHVVNSEIYLKLTNEANGTMCGEVVRKKVGRLSAGLLSKPKKLG